MVASSKSSKVVTSVGITDVVVSSVAVVLGVVNPVVVSCVGLVSVVVVPTAIVVEGKFMVWDSMTTVRLLDPVGSTVGVGSTGFSTTRTDGVDALANVTTWSVVVDVDDELMAAGETVRLSEDD